jgi:hypothetical protein
VKSGAPHRAAGRSKSCDTARQSDEQASGDRYRMPQTGWVVERNGIPLRYFLCGFDLPDQKIVFDNYREAQARASLTLS